jgi:hypothetical protein
MVVRTFAEWRRMEWVREECEVWRVEGRVCVCMSVEGRRVRRWKEVEVEDVWGGVRWRGWWLWARGMVVGVGVDG